MTVLLLTLTGPLQSWGSRSRFTTRATELAPTKSGVIGVIAAARGLQRTDPLDEFRGIRFGVRIDQPGRVERDFQTEISLGGKSMPLSHRYYLADAVFLAGIESDDAELLAGWKQALMHPFFPLYLGRRAFPPAGPICAKVVEGTVESALAEASWQASERHQKSITEKHHLLSMLIDAGPGDVATETFRDEPISFDPRRRGYGWRDVSRRDVQVLNPHGVSQPASVADARHNDKYARSGVEEETSEQHNPMDLLAEGQ